MERWGGWMVFPHLLSEVAAGSSVRAHGDDFYGWMPELGGPWPLPWEPPLAGIVQFSVRTKTPKRLKWQKGPCEGRCITVSRHLDS